MRTTMKNKTLSRYTEEFKNSVLTAVKETKDVKGVAAQFGVNKSTVYSWMQDGGKRKNVDSIEAVIRPKEIKSKSKPANTSFSRVDFCPCCGTSIKAVAIALETYKSIGA